MALPPFNELRLKPGEWPDQQKLEELFDGIFQNFEDAYRSFATSTNVREATSTRSISGAVEASGGIFAGKGFTVSHPSTGVYKITLKEELKTTGVCIASPLIGGFLFALGSVGKKTFEVNVRESATTLANGPFLFTINQTS